jgi:hypothetical protein
MTGRLKSKNSTLAEVQERKKKGQFAITGHNTLLIKIGENFMGLQRRNKNRV